MASTVDKVKNALHLNKHQGTTSTTGTTGTHSGVAEGQAGPHSSRAANAADPRVDSDMDHRATGITGGTGYGTTGGTTGYGTTGNTTHGTGVTGAGTGAAGSTNAGPYSSNLANKLDPRVDSDLDGSRNMGAATGNTSATTGGYGGTHAGNGFGSSTGAGTTGGISSSTNAGPHNSNLANKADPRVDSDLDGRGNRHGAATGGILGTGGSHATPGSGTAQNTAGPHNSDLTNKLDPRVDADLDGSRTVGGNKTHF